MATESKVMQIGKEGLGSNVQNISQEDGIDNPKAVGGVIRGKRKRVKGSTEVEGKDKELMKNNLGDQLPEEEGLEHNQRVGSNATTVEEPTKRKKDAEVVTDGESIRELKEKDGPRNLREFLVGDLNISLTGGSGGKEEAVVLSGINVDDISCLKEGTLMDLGYELFHQLFDCTDTLSQAIEEIVTIRLKLCLLIEAWKGTKPDIAALHQLDTTNKAAISDDNDDDDDDDARYIVRNPLSLPLPFKTPASLSSLDIPTNPINLSAEVKNEIKNGNLLLGLSDDDIEDGGESLCNRYKFLQRQLIPVMLLDLRLLNRNLCDIVKSSGDAVEETGDALSRDRERITNIQSELSWFTKMTQDEESFETVTWDQIKNESISEDTYTAKFQGEPWFVSKQDDPHQFTLNLLKFEMEERIRNKERVDDIKEKRLKAEHHLNLLETQDKGFQSSLGKLDEAVKEIADNISECTSNIGPTAEQNEIDAK